MTTSFIMLSRIRTEKYYNLIVFNKKITMIDIQLGSTKNENVDKITNMGKLIEIRQYGRTYDPDISLYFENENGDKFEYDPSFGSSEAFVEYEPDSEEKSKSRIQYRTSILRDEILGNDWALRPENVVATQGIDTSRFAH